MSASSDPLVTTADGLPAAEIQALLEASPDAVLIVDGTGQIVALNRRVETLFATTAEQLRGRSVEALLPERARRAHAAARAAYAAAPTVREMSARRGLMGQRADGTEFPVEVSLIPVAGSPTGLVMAVVHDVGSRVCVEMALSRADQAVGALDAIADPVLTTDAEGRVDFLNRAAEELTGLARASAHGRPLSEVLPLTSEASGQPIASPALTCLRRGVPGDSCEAVLPPVPGREGRVLDLSTTPIRDGPGAVIGVVLVARDVTHARVIARQLSHQASHDALTGLVNRHEFERRLTRALASVAEERSEHAVCFLDLDVFKRVNDACGHLAGDELLRQLSDAMRDRMRSRDTLARLGGDEFGLLFEHCRLSRAKQIADGIRRAIADYRFIFGAETYAVAASIGVVPIRTGIRRPGDVLRAADAACYVAKRCGGNRIQVSARRNRRAGRSSDEGSTRIISGVDDRLRLYVQPVVPLDHGDDRAARFELLIRLDEGSGEVLPPRAFFSNARRHGMISSIDRWVVRHGIQRLADWQRAHPHAGRVTVSINLDDETVTDGNALALVQEALAITDVQPQTLCFEINEAVVGAHPSACVHLVRELRVLGCQTTLEHGGSGMAAFTLLRRLRPDYLKIAGHIVRGLVRDPVRSVLATALNEVGHLLGLKTMGTHVEGPQALERLRRIGVDYAQGFGIAPPEPWESAFARLG